MRVNYVINSDDNSNLSYNILLMDTEIHKDDGLIEAVEC